MKRSATLASYDFATIGMRKNRPIVQAARNIAIFKPTYSDTISLSPTRQRLLPDRRERHRRCRGLRVDLEVDDRRLARPHRRRVGGGKVGRLLDGYAEAAEGARVSGEIR